LLNVKDVLTITDRAAHERYVAPWIGFLPSGTLNVPLAVPHNPTRMVRRCLDEANATEDCCMTNPRRCAWAEDDPLMSAYHDQEWGVPQRDSRMLWEMLMLEGFQAGLAWITVLRKREAFRKAFAGFNARTVARFGEPRILRLMGNPGIIRARAKIEATILGAQIYCDMQDRGERFSDFCWSFTRGQVVKGGGRKWIASSPLSERISKEMKRRGFKFVGPTIVYAWMQAVGIVNDHSAGCFRRAQLRVS
jgi:DNA-3-methyladenine glycosylase I